MTVHKYLYNPIELPTLLPFYSSMPKCYLLPIGAVGKANKIATLLVKKDEI